MLVCVFKYFRNEFKDDFFKCHTYEKLNYQAKINLILRLVFVLRNGILEVEKPFFQDLINKIAFDNDKKISKILAQQILEIDIDPILVKGLADANFEIARELLKNSSSFDDLSLINICKNNEKQIKLAINLAKRNQLSETLTDYLTSLKNLKIIKLLLLNPNAKLSVNSLVEILENFENNTIIYNKILKLINSNPYALNDFIILLNDKTKKRILISICELNPDKILYFSTRIHLFSFDFVIIPDLITKLSNIVDTHYKSNTLTELVIIKFLCTGDLYSFIYSIAKVAEISFEMVRDITLQNYNSEVFESMLKKAGLSNEMIRASQEIIRALYELCAEKYVDSQNFVILLKRRFKYVDRNLAVCKTIFFLLNLIS